MLGELFSHPLSFRRRTLCWRIMVRASRNKHKETTNRVGGEDEKKKSFCHLPFLIPLDGK